MAVRSAGSFRGAGKRCAPAGGRTRRALSHHGRSDRPASLSESFQHRCRRHFGVSVAVSGDTVVVGAISESSNATGVNGDQTDNSALDAGAAYVFVRNGTTWSQQAYLKASNTEPVDHFGHFGGGLRRYRGRRGDVTRTATPPGSTATRTITAHTVPGRPMFSCATGRPGASKLI